MIEPARVAARLHDGPLQTITAARLQLDALSAMSDALPPGAEGLVRAALAAVEEAGVQCRALMNELRVGDP